MALLKAERGFAPVTSPAAMAALAAAVAHCVAERAQAPELAAAD